jgi:hypothetical protein
VIPNKGYVEAASAYADAQDPSVAQVHATAMVAAALLEVAAAIREASGNKDGA